MKDKLKSGNEISLRRHQKHLTQNELARRIGCSQTAISKVEGGELDALSGDKLEALFHELGLSVPDDSEERLSLAYCGNADCPLGWREVINGRLVIQPAMFEIEPDSVRFCKGCGKPLLYLCQDVHCGAPPLKGAAFCVNCGTPLIETEKYQQSGDLVEFKEKMNQRSQAFRAESQNIETIRGREVGKK